MNDSTPSVIVLGPTVHFQDWAEACTNVQPLEEMTYDLNLVNCPQCLRVRAQYESHLPVEIARQNGEELP